MAPQLKTIFLIVTSIVYAYETSVFGIDYRCAEGEKVGELRCVLVQLDRARLALSEDPDHNPQKTRLAR
jgi:hypothetical protein